MPGTPPERIASNEAFEREHHDLMSMVDRLEASGSPEEVAAVVAELQATLPAHFAREEASDGVFDWLLVLHPDLSPRIVQLTEDHHHLRALLGELEAGSGDVLAGARELAMRLRDHERREGEALRDAKAGGRRS